MVLLILSCLCLFCVSPLIFSVMFSSLSVTCTGMRLGVGLSVPVIVIELALDTQFLGSSVKNLHLKWYQW